MEIIKAKTAGFCFGVDRAVKMTYKLLEEGHKVCTLGPLIHNPQCVQDLKAKGAISVDAASEVPKDSEVIIRSHGVSQSVYDELQGMGNIIHDATCPFVAKIHSIAQRAKTEKATLLVAGDKTHPEVEGIVGHTGSDVFVFDNLQQLMEYSNSDNTAKTVFLVAQTTFEVTKWLECSKFIKKVYTNARIFDTICNATWARQQEAEDLAKRCDLIIVIGGKESSNTQKLVSVARKHTKAMAVETAAELKPEWFEHAECVGVTAGASTPASIIEEVLSTMSDSIQNEELSFAEMFDNFETPSVYGGKDVKGIVTGVSPNEVQVDIGTKHTGFIKIEDFTDDSSARLEDLVKKGDELNLIVVKVNDQEGIVYLSKRQFEARKGEVEVRAAAEDGTVLDGYVKEFNKGGLVAVVKGVNVFIPASQSTLRRGEDYTQLVRKHVKLKIRQVDGQRFIGSIRDALAGQMDAEREKFWAEVEIGKHYTGTVKSLTSYGAFVDIGGVDGLVHISELSWSRIKHPSEIVNAGDTIDVYVKDVDKENHKVSLGYKKTEDDPWEKLKTEFPIGTVFKAPVVSITKFGAFVRMLPGIDGLVHISEISGERVEKVSDVLAVGQEVEVKLIDVDYDKKRISLSMKVLEETPADNGEETVVASTEE
ncbi:MAG: bifunctional 4-hydroxy-3-methylbut-2-enyl diphosphate reductase/30S ribosomal protein S1 [Oscillospiraceae bacterium]